MEIRNGIFTRYEDFDLKLVEQRSEVPVSDDKKAFQIWYQNTEDCPFEDFEKDKFGNGFYKIVPISQIEKVFLIITFGKYKKWTIEVFEGKGDKVQIASRDRTVSEELGMKKIGKEWYMKEVEISDLDLIWEETIEIKQSDTLYGAFLKLNDLWRDKRERIKLVSTSGI